MTKRMYCENCKESFDHNREPTMHIFHFIMTLILPIWVIVWILMYCCKGYVCPKCGTVKK